MVLLKNNDEANRWIERNVDFEGDQNFYDFSPTGLWFADPSVMKTFKERIVIVRRVALDC